MVLKCCVTLCKGYYASSSERVPVCKLSQDEEKKKMDFCQPESQLRCLEIYCSVWKTLAKRCRDSESPWQAETKISTLSFSPNSFLVVCPLNLTIIAKHLLSGGNEYVMIGWFSTDPSEKAFGKLR